MTALTGRGLTFTVVEAVFPSAVAVMVAVPAATAETNPSDVTVATVARLDDHEIARPVIVVPEASCNRAVSCVVCPTTTLSVVGVKSTLATGTSATVIEAVALFPSADAVMKVAPAECAVTTPASVTVAAAGLLLAHVTGRPASTRPEPSSGSATSCSVCPTNMERCVAESRIDATGVGLTVILAKASLPRELAATRTVPTLIPVTTPADETEAMDGSALAHDIRGDAKRLPSASR